MGNNRLDEIIASSLSEPNGLLIEKIVVQWFGDLRIILSNHFELEVFADVSGGEECWRFFRYGQEEHLIITGQGIAVEEAENIENSLTS